MSPMTKTMPYNVEATGILGKEITKIYVDKHYPNADLTIAFENFEALFQNLFSCYSEKRNSFELCRD